MRRTAADAAATRATLIEAALFVFAEEGVATATLGGIADRAQLTRGALYHHFEDKAALLSAVLGEMWAVVATPVWAALGDRDAPLAQRLEAFAVAWLTALHTDRRFTALMAVTVQSPGLSTGTDKAAGLRDWQDRLVAELFPDRSELDGRPEVAAAHLLAWLSCTALLAGQDPDLLPPADATGVAPLMRGLLP